MSATSVTSKGQVTIPQEVRRRLGIRQGSRVLFTVVGDRAELQVVEQPAKVGRSGFGMLKTRLAPAPADFDVASLLAKTPPKKPAMRRPGKK